MVAYVHAFVCTRLLASWTHAYTPHAHTFQDAPLLVASGDFCVYLATCVYVPEWSLLPFVAFRSAPQNRVSSMNVSLKHCPEHAQRIRARTLYLLQALDLETQCCKFRGCHSTVVGMLRCRKPFHCRARCWPNRFIFSISARAGICGSYVTWTRKIGPPVKICKDIIVCIVAR